MTIIEPIPVEPYKQHKGEGDQLGYKGIALNPFEQAAVEKINELVNFLNEFDTIAKTFGFKPADTVGPNSVASADGV